MAKSVQGVRSHISAEREQELLAIARDVFFRRGVDAATMDEIARLAGASKATIYRRYSSKEALFQAVIVELTQRVGGALNDFELDPHNPVESLRTAARTIRQVMFADEHVELMRQVIAEGTRHKAIGRNARDLLISAITKRLALFFGELVGAGKMHHDHPAHAAVTFALLCSGGFRPLLNALGTEDEEQRRFAADFDMFLRGTGLVDCA